MGVKLDQKEWRSTNEPTSILSLQDQ